MEVRFDIPGLPSTDHRARSYVKRDGTIGHRKSKEFADWKRRIRTCAAIARPRGWKLDAPRYAVEVIGYLPEERIDADNLRGVLDACENVLWTNDRRCRPVVYDYGLSNDPRVSVHVVAFDPKLTIAQIDVVLQPREVRA